MTCPKNLMECKKDRIVEKFSHWSNFLKLENHTHLKKVVSRKFESFFRQKINRPQGSFGLSWLD